MLNYIFIIISAAIFLAVIRMLKGPTAADRIVALDTITTIISSLLVIPVSYTHLTLPTKRIV